MTHDSPLRIGLIGAGRMGGYHLEALERMPEATVVALAEPDERRARAAIGRRPIAWAPDHHALLERDDVDAVSICTPSEQHAAVTLDVIASGRHALVEKPIATTLEDGLRMAAAARRMGVKLMVGHVERFNPAVGKVAELIRAGRIGRVYRAHAARVGPLPDRIRDAGVAIDLATHDLDIMQLVLGRDITSVYADGARFRHPTQEDLLTCLLRFGDDGPFGLLDVNWVTPEKRRELTIVGERGMLSASFLTQDVWLTECAEAPTAWDELARLRGDAEGAALRFALRRVEPLRAELEAFVACVRDDTPEPVSAYDGCRTLIAALAIRESAAHRRPVTLLDMPTPARMTVAA
jgi:UDP-N-acetylglucosamine 3-dehydrogenase